VALGLLVVAVAFSISTIDSQSGGQLLDVCRDTARTVARLRWQYAGIVVALAALHYVASTIATRTAAGIALPFGQTFAVQLAAAAANRLTPACIGGSAVLARFLRRKGLVLPSAMAAVVVLAVLNSVANVLVLSLFVFVGSNLGIHGSTRQLSLLTDGVTQRLGAARSPWLWVAAVAIGLVVVVFYVRGRRSPLATLQTAWCPVRALLHRPLDLAAILLAGAMTHVLMALAFVASTEMVTGPRPAAGTVALMIAFMLGSTAGSAVPVPAGLGATEAALIAVLMNLSVPAPLAVEEVVIFRLITFWAPAAIGILAGRRLRRSHAL
jgi:uncharacterized membrane protein YbhN (UPF0104 family)